MEKTANPFIISGYIPDEYFCDRTKETEWLLSLLCNGNNVVLIAPRRMGKTALVEHCYHKREISDSYYTFYVDILPTSSLAEMAFLLGKKVYEGLLPLGKKIINGFISALASIKGAFGFDAISGMPTFTLSVGQIENPERTLEEIFGYLATANKPCIVTIDEFQQISRYRDKHVEATLRSYIQKIKNCSFIFSGSERHMMQQMFRDESRPFYNSAEVIELDAIPRDVMAEFAMRKFADCGKAIAGDDFCRIYDLMQGNIYYIQRLCNRAFALTPAHAICDMETINKALDQLLEMNKGYFNERLSLVSAKHKPLLYAIARQGTAQSILSADFIKSNALASASSVQHAARQLIDDSLLSLNNGVYSLTDKLLSLYISMRLL